MTKEFALERERLIRDGFVIVRVAAEHKDRYSILWDGKIILAEVTGKLIYSASSRFDFPCVGDWVAVQVYEDSHAIIHHVLPRRTYLSRKTVGKEFNEQLIAANIDIVFIVQGLDDNFNLRRLERYLVAAKESGALPIVLLSKADLLDDNIIQLRIDEAKKSVPDIKIIAYSAKTLSHIEDVKSLILPDTVVCFIGSSGVGKSTLINTLIGNDLIEINDVRVEDSKGKHTTSRRELIQLENGGFVIDTPGMRELGLWSVTEGIEGTFSEILELGKGCRFSDCTHVHEPDCAVKDALTDGRLDTKRYENYLKLKKEADYVASKSNILKAQERKSKEKQLGKAIKNWLKLKSKK